MRKYFWLYPFSGWYLPGGHQARKGYIKDVNEIQLYIKDLNKKTPSQMFDGVLKCFSTGKNKIDIGNSLVCAIMTRIIYDMYLLIFSSRSFSYEILGNSLSYFWRNDFCFFLLLIRLFGHFNLSISRISSHFK